ncbi:hypothetical protein RIF29_29774 [Crotalaria pallida]|uniref:MSP domain-containing protein n=1 Tax=Crotalaria pallida TaxID=3830 RepID=A0AAN9EFD7_CROPI
MQYVACKVASPSDLFTLPPSTLVSSVAKSLLPTKRRLRLDPPNEIYFPYEPGKQVRSAIAIKNTCKSHVAFKDSCFKQLLPIVSCYMHPPGGILAPGQSIIATVFKFVEPPENNKKPVEQKSRVKFKITSLKVKGEMDYVPELVIPMLSDINAHSFFNFYACLMFSNFMFLGNNNAAEKYEEEDAYAS